MPLDIVYVSMSNTFLKLIWIVRLFRDLDSHPSLFIAVVTQLFKIIVLLQ